MRLLVVEDEEDLVGAVRLGLVRAGYAVDVALDADQAQQKLLVNEYDLLLLDINLPDRSGFELCRSIRQGELGPTTGRRLRILMLTARDRLEDRVRALLRRDGGASAPVLEVGELRLDPARHEAFRRGRRLTLTRKEFGVLEYLMTQPGHVVSTEELLEHVWDEHTDPFTNTVRVTVGTLRRKLDEGGESRLIETVVGSGYRLTGESR